METQRRLRKELPHPSVGRSRPFAGLGNTLPARSRAGCGCESCCGTPVPRRLTSEQRSIARGSWMQGYERGDPGSAQGEMG